MSDFAGAPTTIKTTQYGRYTVEIGIRRVAVPENRRKAWKSAVGDLYARLEAMIEEDHKNEQNRSTENVSAGAAESGAADGAAYLENVAGGING